MASDAAPVKLNGVVALAARRWYLVTVGLFVALLLGVLAVQHIAPSYTMKASVVLLPPEKTIGRGGNPYLALGGLDAAVDVAAAGLASDAIQQQLAATGATSGVVERDGGTSAPILLITVEAPNAAAAKAGLDVLLDGVPSTLATIQESAGVADEQLVRSEVINSSARPVVTHKPQLRGVLVVVVAGIAATFAVTALLDRLLLRRRMRRGSSAAKGLAQLRIPQPVDDPEADNDVSELMSARGRKR